MRLAREIVRGLVQLLYPALCHACNGSLRPDETSFCTACRTALLTDRFETCPRCARSVGPHVNLEKGCVGCRGESSPFETAIRMGRYEGQLRKVILDMKHITGEGLAEELGLLWAAHAGDRLRASGAQVVVPVPLHWRRRWQRGYNQSEALAIGLAARVGLPCRPGWLRRIRATPWQTQQSPTGRRENLRGAFQARPRTELKGAIVLLVDDVMTTGSTCAEAARALRVAGAARVHVAVLARSEG